VRPSDLPRVAPDKDFSRIRDGLIDLLRRTGLTGVICDTITWTHRTDPESWWSGPANGIGSAGALMQRQDAGTIARIRTHYDRYTAAYRDADGQLALPTAALVAAASISSA
jgi:hypothetical protein